MLKPPSLATEGLGRPPARLIALLLEYADPAELGRPMLDPDGTPPASCACASCLKMRSRASLYAASRSSSVRALPLPSSSAPMDEEADEVGRWEVRGRILKNWG